jgi:hypothetical protein
VFSLCLGAVQVVFTLVILDTPASDPKNETKQKAPLCSRAFVGFKI